jgi:hypothetical protein
MKKVVAILLLVASLGLGYMGINQLNDSSASVSIGELEISAESSEGKTTGYVYIGLAIAALAGGVALIRRN